jgi:hypothetical protein
MIDHCIENLNQIKRLIASLPEKDFQKQSENLFCSTIGEHVRHILEFYSCLLEGINRGEVNYDTRKRQKELECQPEIAMTKIDDIAFQLKQIPEDKPLVLKANYSINENVNELISTSVNRELGYCLEHCIHHQALIKSALKEHNCLSLVEKEFGVAASTLRNKKACVQ